MEGFRGFCVFVTWLEFERQGMHVPAVKDLLMCSLDSFIAGAPISAGGASP